jgi:hypothetical protein
VHLSDLLITLQQVISPEPLYLRRITDNSAALCQNKDILSRLFEIIMDYDYIIEKPRQALCPLLIGASNYPTWKSKIEMVLVRERLWSIISGRRVKPESGAKALTDFEEDCERATATIFLYLSDTAE